MLRFENVATPFTAGTLSVPASVPPAGSAPIATVMVPVKLVTVFPEASRALTCTAGVIVAPASVLLGCTVKPRCVAAGGGGSGAVDRKSTRLNSSHLVISYAVFCLKKKKKKH